MILSALPIVAAALGGADVADIEVRDR